MVRKCNYILRDVEDAIPYGLNHETFHSQDVCTSQARRDVEDTIPYGLNHETFSSQDVCTSQAWRDVEDAIPYILDDETFFHRMSAPRKLGGMSRTPSPTV